MTLKYWTNNHRLNHCINLSLSQVKSVLRTSMQDWWFSSISILLWPLYAHILFSLWMDMHSFMTGSSIECAALFLSGKKSHFPFKCTVVLNLRNKSRRQRNQESLLNTITNSIPRREPSKSPSSGGRQTDTSSSHPLTPSCCCLRHEKTVQFFVGDNHGRQDKCFTWRSQVVSKS